MPLGDVVARRASTCLAPPAARDLLRQTVVGEPLEDARADRDGDLVRVERALRREQPLAALVLLADDRRRVGACRRAASLICVSISARFSSTTMIVSRPSAKRRTRLRLERPGAARPCRGEPEVGGADLVDAEVVERLQHVEVALAGRDDADPRPAAAGDHVRSSVLARRRRARAGSLCRAAAPPARAGGRGADVEPARRHAEAAGDDGSRRGRASRRSTAVDSTVSLTHFRPTQQPAKRDKREAEEAVVEDLLDARRD